MTKRVEIRRREDAIDEIVAKGCMVIIEQLSDSNWSVYIDAEEASYWFEIGAKNARTAVNVRLIDTEVKRQRVRR